MVIVTVDDVTQGKLHGQVREKVKFPAQVNPNGEISKRAFSRYFVVLTDRPDAEALVDDEHIFRDRKVFSKQMLRSYLRNCLTRESWTGAPWQIKEKLAQQYRIDVEIPPHLRYDAALIQRKMKMANAKDPYGSTTDFQSAADTSFDLKPKGPKAKKNAQIYDKERLERSKLFEKAFASDLSLTTFQRNGKISHAQALHYMNGDPIQERETPSEPPPPPIKYPREDLENPVTKNVRPSLKTLQESMPEIRPETVGELLEVWDFLNVYVEIFVLDSFVFDDFVDALRFSAEDYQCELLVELHCAVLKRLVNDEKDLNGKVQIDLPSQDLEEDEDEDTKEKTRTPTPEPEFKRTTRRSLAKAEAQEAQAQAQATIDVKIHLGAEIDRCVPNQDWKARLRKRNFANGMWVVIVVGLLNLFSMKPQLKSRCEALLAKLAPINMSPTEETAISQYTTLDVNDRVAILQFLTMLSVETRAVKDYIDDCSLTMTKHRKDKVEYQKKRKEHLAELKALDEERRNILPSAVPSQEITELAQDLEDTDVVDDEEEADKGIVDTGGEDDEEVIPSRFLRRAKDRENERKKRIEEERRRKEEAKAEKAKKPSKEAREFEKLTKKIEKVKDMIKGCESAIATCDEDIRQNDIPRLKSLGKDRFYNRYYWFERNAMPYGGMPNASTAHAEYMNGCIWVQGPDPMEREGFIDLREGENTRYAAMHGCTMPERKILEEGKTSLDNLSDWGFYDSPDDLDNLLGWLSDKGDRESRLKKEISIQREQISINMEKRGAYLNQGRTNPESVEPVTRVTTRTRTYVDPAGHRFMKWHNSIALEKLGHIHSDTPRIVKKLAVTKGVKRKSEEKDEGPFKRTRGRPPAPKVVVDITAATTTRRGTRYGK